MSNSIPCVAQPDEPHTGPECAECARLAKQATAAELTADWKRVQEVTDVFAVHLGVVTQ